MKTRLMALIFASLAVAACDDQLNVNPVQSVPSDDALSNLRGLQTAITGAYTTLTSGNTYGRNLPAYADLYADNLTFTGTFTTDQEVGLRNITAPNGNVTAIWLTAYDGINRVNSVLEAVPNVAGLTAAQANQLRGEALFIRALHYHTLVRAFGGVPLVLTPTKVASDNAPARSTQAETYSRIIADLEEAATLLPTTRTAGRANRAAANALLARVYLDNGQYALARDRATTVIGLSGYSLLANYRDIFTTKHHAESIFELSFSTQNTNSQAFWFFPSALGGRRGYAPTLNLFNSYEWVDTDADGVRDANEGDPRRAATIALSGTSRYGFKFWRIATSDDNVIILRLAEMYLIRAEANYRLGQPAATVLADVNVVRARAGRAPLDPAVVDTDTELRDAILNERRWEFALEGHRFYDLRRMGVATTVLSINAERLLWPIPQREMDTNPALVQNAGY
jgi:starch-binding outer membrane protein, SusD/RagB family